MGILRRRKSPPQETQPAPRRSDPANTLPPTVTRPEDWKPAELGEVRRETPPPNRRDTWIPSGVVPMPPQRRRSGSHPALQAIDPETDKRPPDAAPAPPADAPPAAAADAAPPADRAELHSRIAALEAQIEQARASQSSEQAATIRALQLRLAALEEELAKSAGPRYPQPASKGSTALRLIVLGGVFFAIALSPLFMITRTICDRGGKPETRWSVVKPFDDSGPRRCETQLGSSVLLESLGIE